MLDPDGLNVWSDQQLVGYLWRNTQGQIGFRYEEDWLTQGGFAVSHTLPLRHEDFTPEEGLAHRFFANLLPEGGVRDQIVRDLKIANTDFDLLRAIGGECAGALSVLQAEYQPSTEHEYYKVSDEDLANLVARRGQVYTWSANERPRLSLAGAQDKCPVLVKNDAYWLPKKESPTSHILKFELPDYRHLPAYETFTTLLAGAIGLPVVDIQLRSVADKHYALIERYDRRGNEKNQIVRLHQEDFCQALGLGHERKYQEDGGPSFADCYRLVQDVSSDPANDLQYLLRWQIFNVLAGNSDGHGKNLSLLYQPNGEIRLAPFYDLVCTRAIERIDYHLAFSVGNERNPGVVSLKNWDNLAQQCGLRPRFLQKQVQDVAARLQEQLQPTREKFESLYGDYAALQRIEQIVTKQCRRTVNK
ncbi:MAG: type II toxin-antitoxin system HipA family toxin [Exilibacterium sp.]